MTLAKNKQTKNRHIGQWNQIGDTDINSHTIGCLIFDKINHEYKLGKKRQSSTNDSGQLHGCL